MSLVDAALERWVNHDGDGRFWSHVKKGTHNECWPWTGGAGAGTSAVRDGLYRRGDKVSTAKLTSCQIEQIRARHIGGFFGPNNKSNGKLLAKEFGVSQSTIHRIVKRDYWTHI